MNRLSDDMLQLIVQHLPPLQLLQLGVEVVSVGAELAQRFFIRDGFTALFDKQVELLCIELEVIGEE